VLVVATHDATFGGARSYVPSASSRPSASLTFGCSTRSLGL
jgi:hypothetical protein